MSIVLGGCRAGGDQSLHAINLTCEILFPMNKWLFVYPDALPMGLPARVNIAISLCTLASLDYWDSLGGGGGGGGDLLTPRHCCTQSAHCGAAI